MCRFKAKNCYEQKERVREKRELFVYCSASFIFAIGAFFFTDSISFMQAAFEE
jgi:hypothetical protein